MREYAKKPENQSRTLDSNSKASKQAPIDVILQRYKQNIQRYALAEEEELLQGKFESTTATEQEPVQREEKSNNTGLPDNLKTGVENLSGYSMNDVRVHYNSNKPAPLQALAYTQGTDIHVAPGQEKHLLHEAWHVVQQKQGRVRPTTQLQGININDNEGLEKEADAMGEKTKEAAIRQTHSKTSSNPEQLKVHANTSAMGVLQRTREDVEKLLPQATDLTTVLADTSLNIHYRCTLLLINNRGLKKSDKNYIGEMGDITSQMIQDRGSLQEDQAFKYYQNFIISHTRPPFLTSSKPETSQVPADIETPRDKILRALYEHTGFISLKDGYTTMDTQEKFGLEKEAFDKAFKELWDEKIVAPIKEPEPGLNLSKKGNNCLSPILGDETEINKNNIEKKQLYILFGKTMQKIGIDVFLIGGAASTILGESRRKIKDLDFKTNSITKPFNDEESKTKIAEINKKIYEIFPNSVITDFEINKQNIHAIDGKIDEVDITIGRFMNSTHFKQYEPPQNFLISSKDLLLDKAESFIFRKSDDKKTTDLFDLTWTLHSLNYNFGKLYELLGEREKFYEHKKEFLKEKNEYAEMLKDEFTSSVASFLSRGGIAIHKLFLNHIKNKANIRIVEEMLLKSFPIVFGKDVKKGKPSLIIQAGNMTGDMFGVSAAMILNPLAHVLIIYENSERDKHNTICNFYLQSVDKDRIHLMEAPNISTAYTEYSGRQNKKQLPYDAITPEIPDFLRSPSLQYPLSEATSQVAEFYDKKSPENIKEAWKVDAHSPGYENFMKTKGIPSAGVKYAILWSRYSGKKGGPHIQHDTSFKGMEQLVKLARDTGYVVLISGDKPATKRPDKFNQLNVAGHVFDLTEFWNSTSWTNSGLKSDRVEQLGFFEYLKTKGDVKHLGFRSGNLEAFALMGQTVGYMEEEGNLQKGRMEAWHGAPIRYNRVQINLPPTFTGKYIVTKIKHEGLKKEPTPEWLTSDGKSKPETEKSDRGFSMTDLDTISNFFAGGSPDADKKPASKPNSKSQKKPDKTTKDSAPHQELQQKVPNSGVIASYVYPENRLVTTFDTMGDGSCGIHAMYGTMQETGSRNAFRHDNAPLVRNELAVYISEHKEALKTRYKLPLAEIIREIYIKVIQTKPLSESENQQWNFFKQEIPELKELMASILDTEKTLSAALNQNRSNLIEEIIQLTVRQEGAKLILFLINEFEKSTSKMDEACKTALVAVQTLDEKRGIILKSDRLANMIQINIDEILNMIDKEQLVSFKAYNKSIQDIDPSHSLTVVLVEDNINKLFDAYTKIVQEPNYYLRQEDLLSLADMRNEGIVIYREHDTIPGSAVETLSHAPDRATVRRIFHRGVHYKHAELKENGTV